VTHSCTQTHTHTHTDTTGRGRCNANGAQLTTRPFNGVASGASNAADGQRHRSQMIRLGARKCDSGARAREQEPSPPKLGANFRVRHAAVCSAEQATRRHASREPVAVRQSANNGNNMRNDIRLVQTTDHTLGRLHRLTRQAVGTARCTRGVARFDHVGRAMARCDNSNNHHRAVEDSKWTLGAIHGTVWRT
jgi:hypothetical protein